MYLEKESTLIRRDTAGEVLPVEIELELLPDKPKVSIRPLLKGDIQRLLAGGTPTEKEKLEEELVRTHCVNPAYSEEDMKFLKPEIYGAIKVAILSISTGKSQEAIKNDTVKIVLDELEEKKKS